jgi:sterol desaturase/sphingolipid hydroxylase (fatty acid hydroxylase superfamily)
VTGVLFQGQSTMQEQMIRRLCGGVLDSIVQMSRTPANYWAEFALDIPVGIVLIFEGLRHHDIRPGAVFLTILFGLFLFSFCEYFFHRWLFHGSMMPLMAKGHHAHHVNPLGYDALPFFLPALVLLGLTGGYVLLMPARYAFLLSGAMAFGYVTYGLSHFSIHHTRFRNHLARRWAANHHIHHYHSESNFGVTTPLWDILLGTRYVWNHKRI